MRFGVTILPEHPWSVAGPMWRRAEELGFDQAWTYDHLTWTGLVGHPWYGTVSTLTAAAMVTERMRLGTFVTSPNFRHPLTLTRDILALDDISAGRFIAGIGSGGGIDSRILGGEALTPRQMVDRLEEFVVLLDRLLTSDEVDFEGQWFSTVDARTAPGCVQQPRVPFVVAANGPRSLRLAARIGQGWVTTGPRVETLDEWFGAVGGLGRRMDSLLEAEGRDAATFERHLSFDASPQFSLASAAVFEEMTGRAAGLGFTDVISHWPRPDGPYAGDVEVLKQVAADVMPRLR